MHINLEITNGCNQSCIYCFNNSGVARTNELHKNEWINIIDYFLSDGLRSVLITGGEPFIRDDVWEILGYLLEKGINTSILSNGCTINDRLPKSKRELIRRLNRAQISLDSANPEVHNRRRGRDWAWATAMTAISHLRFLNVNVEISTTISSDIIDELDGVTEIAYRTGSKVLIRPLVPVGRARRFHKTKDLKVKIGQKRRSLEQKYHGEIFVDDFAFYVPVIPDIDILGAKNSTITIQPNGAIRGYARISQYFVKNTLFHGYLN